MPRTFAGFVLLLAMLALALPGRAVAGPPEGVSGKMMFDEVADGLRKYRKKKDVEKRYKMLEKLAPTKDARVAIAIMEAGRADFRVYRLLAEFFVQGTRFEEGSRYHLGDWWTANEADLRRRAKQLPQ